MISTSVKKGYVNYSTWKKGLVKGVVQATEHFLSIQGVPPKRRKLKMRGFKSDKQRKLVFAKIKAGEIPRSRTNRLVNSLTTKVDERGEGVVGIVGTNLNHAQYVIDKIKQNRMFKDVWVTMQENEANQRKTIINIIDKAIKKAVLA